MQVRRASGAAFRRVLFAGALLCPIGCASVPPPGAVPPPPAASARTSPVPAPAPARVEPRREPARTAAAVDSTPSQDAERVLATIPDPLSPAQQALSPARDTLRRAVSAVAPEAAYDTLRIERAPGGEEPGVPVPSPTQPLGNVPPVTFAPAESTLVAPARNESQPSAPPATATPASAPRTAAAGECWRLQVAAPVEQAMAASRRDAAQSLLVVPMVIELERGLYKVRTHDCMTRAAADALKLRATDSGFEGAFVVNTAAKQIFTPPARKAPSPHRKKRR